MNPILEVAQRLKELGGPESHNVGARVRSTSGRPEGAGFSRLPLEPMPLAWARRQRKGGIPGVQPGKVQVAALAAALARLYR